MITQDYVRRYWERQGLFCIPVMSHSKKPTVKWKTVWMANGHKPLLEDVINLFQENVSIVCGEYSNGFCAIDLDDKALADSFFQANKLLSQQTTVVQTSDGYHVWLRQVGEGRIPTIDYRPTIAAELRGEGVLLSAPPSIHESGHCYRFIGKANSIMEVENAEQWFKDRLQEIDITLPPPPSVKPRVSLSVNGGPVPEGQRHEFMKHQTGRIVQVVREFKLGINSAYDWAEDINQARCSPPLDREEVESLVEYAWQKEGQ